MNTSQVRKHWETTLALVCVCLLLFISACQGSTVSPIPSSTPTSSSKGTSQVGSTGSPKVQLSPQNPTSTAASAQGADTPAPTTTPVQGTSTPVSPTATAVNINYNHPVLAFYYTWYTPSTWCSCTMSDLPTLQYN